MHVFVAYIADEPNIEKNVRLFQVMEGLALATMSCECHSVFAVVESLQVPITPLLPAVELRGGLNTSQTEWRPTWGKYIS